MKTQHRFKTPHFLLNKNVNITVVGVGGTGSVVLSLLAQMNYLLRAISDDTCSLTVTAYDSDNVSQYNLGRQNFWPMDLNKNKAKVLVDRLNLGFGTGWIARDQAFAADSYLRTDVLLTCVDNVKLRLDLGKHYQHAVCDTLWGDCGNDKDSGQVIFGHLGQPESPCKLPNWFDLYGDTMAMVTESVTDSCSHADALRKQDFGVNHQSALLLIQPLWQLLRHGELLSSGSFFDIHELDVSKLPIDPVIWETFGYAA